MIRNIDRSGKLHHLEIYVSNINVSKEFWGWILQKLGYKQYQQWEEGISYKLGTTYIVFVQAENKYLDIPYHRKRVGLNHIAFRVNKDEIESYKKELSSKGIHILYKDMKYKDKIFFEDPDRIKVELAAY